MNISPLNYASVDKELLRAVPELEARYDKETRWQSDVGGKPGQYDIVCFVLKPFLLESLDSSKNSALLLRVFAFFEEMARSSDIEVPNLLQVGIFESLVGQRERLATAWKFMGPETKKIARNTARIWRREENLPEE
jgi:hypothetical protein